jgi:hypothetical protein
MHIEENPGFILWQEQQLLRYYTHQRKDAYRGESRVDPSARAAAPQVHPSEKVFIKRRIQGPSFGRYRGEFRVHPSAGIEENPGSILQSFGSS